MTPRTFQRHLRRGQQHLADRCPRLADWIATMGDCRLEVAWDRSIYESLVRAIAHQQLHGQAARRILERFCTAFGAGQFPAAERVAQATTEELRAAGFSLAKLTAVQGVARAACDGQLVERRTAEQLSNEAIINQLVELRGVGRWTVEMLLIFTLGRLDVMPADDYGVRSGFRLLYEWETLPTPKQLLAATVSWQPYASIASWYLWRYAEQHKT